LASANIAADIVRATCTFSVINLLLPSLYVIRTKCTVTFLIINYYSLLFI